MKVQSFKELIVWQRSRELVKEIYSILKYFPPEEKFGIVDQLRRASISLIANIAEGKNRQSRKEFIQFLYIAYGSSAEIEAIMIISIDLKFISKEQASRVLELTNEVQRMLQAMTNTLKAKS